MILPFLLTRNLPVVFAGSMRGSCHLLEMNVLLSHFNYQIHCMILPSLLTRSLPVVFASSMRDSCHDIPAS
jgi:hypothetical protein